MKTLAEKSRHIPTIHMNGTSADMLTGPLGELYSSLGMAYEFSRECTPNMRDYYIERDGRERYELMLTRVHSWQKRIDEIRNEIEKDIGEIEAQRR